MSPTTVNDVDMNNLFVSVSVAARERERRRTGRVCVVLSAGCVLTDEVTPKA